MVLSLVVNSIFGGAGGLCCSIPLGEWGQGGDALTWFKCRHLPSPNQNSRLREWGADKESQLRWALNKHSLTDTNCHGWVASEGQPEFPDQPSSSTWCPQPWCLCEDRWMWWCPHDTWTEAGASRLPNPIYRHSQASSFSLGTCQPDALFWVPCGGEYRGMRRGA